MVETRHFDTKDSSSCSLSRKELTERRHMSFVCEDINTLLWYNVICRSDTVEIISLYHFTYVTKCPTVSGRWNSHHIHNTDCKNVRVRCLTRLNWRCVLHFIQIKSGQYKFVSYFIGSFIFVTIKATMSRTTILYLILANKETLVHEEK